MVLMPSPMWEEGTGGVPLCERRDGELPLCGGGNCLMSLWMMAWTSVEKPTHTVFQQLTGIFFKYFQHH